MRERGEDGESQAADALRVAIILNERGFGSANVGLLCLESADGELVRIYLAGGGGTVAILVLESGSGVVRGARLGGVVRFGVDECVGRARVKVFCFYFSFIFLGGDKKGGQLEVSIPSHTCCCCPLPSECSEQCW